MICLKLFDLLPRYSLRLTYFELYSASHSCCTLYGFFNERNQLKQHQSLLITCLQLHCELQTTKNILYCPPNACTRVTQHLKNVLKFIFPKFFKNSGRCALPGRVCCQLSRCSAHTHITMLFNFENCRTPSVCAMLLQCTRG